MRGWRDRVPRTVLPKGPASCSETGSTHRVQVPTAKGRGGRSTGLLAFSACLERRSLSRHKPPLSCKSPHLFLFWTYSLLARAGWTSNGEGAPQAEELLMNF